MKTLTERINELEQLQNQATCTPWYKGDKTEDDYGTESTGVGPYDFVEKYGEEMANNTVNTYYEDTIAEFWGDNHDCEANAKFVIAAVNLVPELIERIRELEKQTTTELPENMEALFQALDKWRKSI